MNLPPHYIPPYVKIELDTAVPQIGVEATVWIMPPNDLMATITSDEPMGWASLSFTDAVLERHELGFERISDVELQLRMSIEEIVGGWGALHVEVADTVGNRTLKNVAVFINKLVLLDVDLEIGLSLDTAVWASHGFNVLHVNGLGLDTWVDVDHGFEVTQAIDKGLDVRGELTNA